MTIAKNTVRNARTTTPTPAPATKHTTSGVSTPSRATQKEYPLITVEPRFLDWDFSFTDASQGFHLTPSTCKATSAAISPENPTIFFCGDVYAEIMHIVKEAGKKTGECGGFAFIKRVNPHSAHWVAYDHFMVGQTATGGDVEFPGDEIVRSVQHYLDTYPEQFKDSWDIHTHLLQWHSHGNGGVFWSGTDKAQQEDKAQLAGQGQFRLYSVFNTRGDQKSAIRVYDPVASMHDDIAMGIYTGEDGSRKASLTKQRKAELDNWVDKLVDKKVAYATGFGTGNCSQFGKGAFGHSPDSNFLFGKGAGGGVTPATRRGIEDDRTPLPVADQGASQRKGTPEEDTAEVPMNKIIDGIRDLLQKIVHPEDKETCRGMITAHLGQALQELRTALAPYTSLEDGEELSNLIMVDLVTRVMATDNTDSVGVNGNADEIKDTIENWISTLSVNLDLLYDTISDMQDMEFYGLGFSEMSHAHADEWDTQATYLLEQVLGADSVHVSEAAYLALFE